MILRKLSEVKNNTNSFTIATLLNQDLTINDKFGPTPYVITSIPKLNHELILSFEQIIIPNHSSYW